jgi:hypothetical protein
MFANPRDAALAFLKALGHVSLRTVPYIVIGVIISSLIVPWSIDGPLVIALIAALAVLWRETTPGVALGLAAGVWLIAVLAGMTAT